MAWRHGPQRPAGMIDSSEGGPFLLEADQGDTLVGQVSRDEVADALATVTAMPEAAYKVGRRRGWGRGRWLTEGRLKLMYIDGTGSSIAR